MELLRTADPRYSYPSAMGAVGRWHYQGAAGEGMRLRVAELGHGVSEMALASISIIRTLSNWTELSGEGSVGWPFEKSYGETCTSARAAVDA